MLADETVPRTSTRRSVLGGLGESADLEMEAMSWRGQMLLYRTVQVIALGLALSACRDAGTGSASVALPAKAREVIGDLGGVPVRIPFEFAKSVEYDDDPAILEPRSKPVPARNFSSKLRSFGFNFRYPDMAGPGSEEASKDRAADLPGNTFWITVGLNAGEDYPGAGSTERLTSAALGRPEAITGAMYRRAAEKACGLETYVLTGNDPKTGRPNREHSNADDIFVDRDAAGKAKTFIQCSNRPLNAAPCKQHFDLEPQIRAMVYLSYRRGLLCEARGIQSATSQLISGFRATGQIK